MCPPAPRSPVPSWYRSSRSKMCRSSDTPRSLNSSLCFIAPHLWAIEGLRSADASILVVVVGDTRTILADGRKSVPLVEFLFLRLASWIEDGAFGLGSGANGVTTVGSKPVRGRVVLLINEPHVMDHVSKSVSDHSPWSDCPKRQHRSCSTGSEHETPGL